MPKSKILHSDLPRPYDADAAWLIKAVALVMLSCLILSLIVIGIKAIGG